MDSTQAFRLPKPFPDVARSSDRPLYWPSFVVFCFICALAVFGAWPEAVLFAIFGPVPALLVAVLTASIMFLVDLSKRRWRRAASLALLPTFFIALMLAPKAVIGSIGRIGIHTRFAMEFSSYEAALTALPNNGKRFRVFDWGGWGPYSSFVIFDESDNIVLPPDKYDWGDMAGGLAQQCAGRTMHLAGHYYLCPI